LLTGGCAGLAAFPLSSATSLVTTPNAAALELHNQTEIRLDEANFVMVATNVSGRSRGFALLGFISLVPARFITAMNRLYIDAGMETGRPQTLAGMVVEKSSTYCILFSIPQIEVRADVVEFITRPPTDEESPDSGPMDTVRRPVSGRDPPRRPGVRL